jgi:CO/xanthine dehydrogenase FAD-binding subunit
MEFRSARSLEAALLGLAELGDKATVLAGGTDVMIQQLRGEFHPETLLYIGRLDELRGITVDQRIRIGALTSHRVIGTSVHIKDPLPALAEASAKVGGWQTQEVGTLGGNVCNASPAADTIPPLMVADALVSLASSAGTRELPIDQFIVDRRTTARRPDELVTGFEMLPPLPGSGETYLKVGRRSAMEVSVVGLAVRLTFAADEVTVIDARIAAGSVAPTPFRARRAEKILEGSHLEADAVGEAARLLVEQAAPIDDTRASASYRSRVLASLLPRALDICRQRATGTEQWS